MQAQHHQLEHHEHCHLPHFCMWSVSMKLHAAMPTWQPLQTLIRGFRGKKKPGQLLKILLQPSAFNLIGTRANSILLGRLNRGIWTLCMMSHSTSLGNRLHSQVHPCSSDWISLPCHLSLQSNCCQKFAPNRPSLFLRSC